MDHHSNLAEKQIPSDTPSNYTLKMCLESAVWKICQRTRLSFHGIDCVLQNFNISGKIKIAKPILLYLNLVGLEDLLVSRSGISFVSPTPDLELVLLVNFTSSRVWCNDQLPVTRARVFTWFLLFNRKYLMN